jgi:hypothetical protein
MLRFESGEGRRPEEKPFTAGAFAFTLILQAPSLPKMQGIKRIAVNFTASA